MAMMDLEHRSGNSGSRTTDPTELTDRAISRLKKAVTEEIDSKLAVRDERLSGIDEATELRLQTVENLSATVDREIDHAKEVLRVQIVADSRFEHAEVEHLREVDNLRFQSAERLAARESELNAVALAAAFAAQKEASAKEAEYMRTTSVKTESATTQAINKLGELFATQFGGLSGNMSDIKDRVSKMENVKVGATENRSGLYALIAAAGLLVLVTIGLVTLILSIPHA